MLTRTVHRARYCGADVAVKEANGSFPERALQEFTYVWLVINAPVVGRDSLHDNEACGVVFSAKKPTC